MQYTIDDCWTLVKAFVKELKNQNVEAKSLILYNSMTRGDFVDGRSDVDMMAVVDSKSTARKLREFYMSFCKGHGCGDEPEFWKSQNTIPFQLYIYTTRELGKMDFGIYYDDFIRHHVVLHGGEVGSLIKRPATKTAAKNFILDALKASENWNNPSPEVMKRHLKWPKFYPAYLAIETVKAALLYFGILDFDRRQLIRNIERVPKFREKELAQIVLEIYLKGKAREMSSEKLIQTYHEVYRLIRHVSEMCEVVK